MTAGTGQALGAARRLTVSGQAGAAQPGGEGGRGPGADAGGRHGSARSGSHLRMTLCQDHPPIAAPELGLHPEERAGKHQKSKYSSKCFIVTHMN